VLPRRSRCLERVPIVTGRALGTGGRIVQAVRSGGSRDQRAGSTVS
jgi:hypothetical protein